MGSRGRFLSDMAHLQRNMPSWIVDLICDSHHIITTMQIEPLGNALFVFETVLKKNTEYESKLVSTDIDHPNVYPYTQKVCVTVRDPGIATHLQALYQLMCLPNFDNVAFAMSSKAYYDQFENIHDIPDANLCNAAHEIGRFSPNEEPEIVCCNIL